MSLDGALEVVFEDGLPKPIRPKTPSTLTSSKPIHQAPQQPHEDRNRGFENKINEIKQLRVEPDLKAPKPARSSSKKPYYPSNISGNAKMDMPEVMYNPPTKTNDLSTSKMNASALTTASISSATVSAAGVSSGFKSSYQEVTSIAPSSSSIGDTITATNNPSKKKVTFASILESMRNHPHSNSSANREDRDRLGSQQQQQQAKAAEPRSWSEAWSEAASGSISSIPENKKAAATQSTTASTSLPTAIRKPHQPRTSTGDTETKPSENKAAIKTKPAKKGIDTGIVVERTPTGPMSAAAIMTKQEPDEDISTNISSSGAHNATVIIADTSKKGVDEPPTPATAATLSARSIEGYVQLPDGSSMAVARTGQVRVAPRTLLQGLSYNPFPTANVSKKTTKDEGDQSTDSEVEDEEEYVRYAESESNVK